MPDDQIAKQTNGEHLHMTKKVILSATTALIMASSVGISNVFAAEQMGGLSPQAPIAVDEEGHEDGDDKDHDGDGEEGDHTYTIKITNETGHDITSLYLSPADKEDWDEDLLEGDDPLADGESGNVEYHESEDEYAATMWDLKAEMEGDDMEFHDLELDDADENHVTLNEDGTATVE